MKSIFSRALSWLDSPADVLRLELIRIFAPLAILGFMAPRLAHADEWLGRSGFRVPDLAGDVRQPLYVPALPPLWVSAVAIAMVASGLACSLGWKTRRSALAFATVLVFVALSDRLAAFTVSKISPFLVLALAVAPAGERLGVDAWLTRRRGGSEPARRRPLGALRFIQLFLPVFYCASGVAKARGAWLSDDTILYSHVHDSYQTAISLFLAQVTPRWLWAVLPWPVLVFETFAPVWFAIRQTRPFAFAYAVSLHVMIGLMFGPVIWFALLMIVLNVGAYLPERWFARVEAWALRVEEGGRARGEGLPAKVNL